MKASGESDENAWSKRNTWKRSIPIRCRHSAFSRSVDSRAGACSGAKNSRGCGSKLSTQLGRPRIRATSRRRASMVWCPRCKPSKLPMVTAWGVPSGRKPWVMRIAGEAPKSAYSSRFEPLFRGAPDELARAETHQAERGEVQRDAAADQQRQPEQPFVGAGGQPPLRLAHGEVEHGGHQRNRQQHAQKVGG